MILSRSRLKILVIAIVAVSSCGCVYYNTFFWARQKFQQAEKSQTENTQRQQQNNQQGDQSRGGSPAQPLGKPAGSGRQQQGNIGAIQVTAQERLLYEDAIKKASKVLTYHPNSKWVDDALWLIGKAYFNMGDYILADKKFKELVTNLPQSKFAAESYFYMGLCQINLGHNDQAISAFSELETNFPKSSHLSDVLFVRGVMEVGQENYQDAAGIFTDYVKKYSGADSAAAAVYYTGFCREKLKDYFGAYQVYSSVKKYSPSRAMHFDATLASATAALKADSITLGMKILQDLSRDERYFARTAEIHLRLAEGYYLQKDVDKSIETYKEIITQSPKTDESAEAYYRLGLIYQNDKFDLPAAKEAFAKAQSESPSSEYRSRALARSAQIAKLEMYQSQLQRADSLQRSEQGLPPLPPNPSGSSEQAIAESLSLAEAGAQAPPADKIITPADSAIASLGVKADSLKTSEEKRLEAMQSLLLAPDSAAVMPPDSLDQARIRPATQADSARLMQPLGADSTMAVASDTVTADMIAVVESPSDSLADTSQAIVSPPANPVPIKSEAELTQAARDSIRQAILQTGIETRYLLSELYAYELNRPDSALHEYLMIADEYPESPFAAKSLIAAAQIAFGRGDSAAARGYLERLLRQQPRSPQAAMAAEMLQVPLDMSGNALGLYAVAESLVFQGNNPDSALILFRYIADNFPDLAPKANYSIAWALDAKGVSDSSAYYAYDLVAKKYPQTIYAQAAGERLGTIVKQQPRRQQTRREQEPAPDNASAPDSTSLDSLEQLTQGLPVAPRSRRQGEFIYPQALLGRDLKGRVIFKIKLDVSGKVSEYQIIGPSGEKAIDSAAVVALMATEFDTGRLDLNQLDGYFQYTIPFRRPKITIFDDQYRRRDEEGP